MARFIGKAVLLVLILGVVTSCVTIASQRFTVRRDIFETKYDSVKKIVLEEAANNGFTQMTAEIKPSKFNGWKGQIYFSLVTPNGTDQLFVEFEPQGDAESVYVNGAGTRTNPDSASQAIEARLNQL